MRTVFAALCLAGLLATGSCFFDTPEPECSFACSAEGECPEGYTCTADDNICRRDDVDPSFVCEGTAPGDGDGDGDGDT